MTLAGRPSRASWTPWGGLNFGGWFNSGRNDVDKLLASRQVPTLVTEVSGPTCLPGWGDPRRVPGLPPVLGVGGKLAAAFREML